MTDVPREEWKTRNPNLIKTVHEKHLKTIANQVSTALARILTSFPDFLRTPKEIQLTWMKSNYRNIVATVVAPACGNSETSATKSTSLMTGSATTRTAKSTRRPAWSAMLEYPTNRNVRQRGDKRPEDQNAQHYFTLANICQSNSQSNAKMVQSYMLQSPAQARWVKVKKGTAKR